MILHIMYHNDCRKDAKIGCRGSYAATLRPHMRRGGADVMRVTPHVKMEVFHLGEVGEGVVIQENLEKGSHLCEYQGNRISILWIYVNLVNMSDNDKDNISIKC